MFFSTTNNNVNNIFIIVGRNIVLCVILYTIIIITIRLLAASSQYEGVSGAYALSKRRRLCVVRTNFCSPCLRHAVASGGGDVRRLRRRCGYLGRGDTTIKQTDIQTDRQRSNYKSLYVAYMQRIYERVNNNFFIILQINVAIYGLRIYRTQCNGKSIKIMILVYVVCTLTMF